MKNFTLLLAFVASHWVNTLFAQADASIRNVNYTVQTGSQFKDNNSNFTESTSSPQTGGISLHSTVFMPISMIENIITGSVLADNGEALVGVNILVKGTTTGVVSDIDGKYSLNVPAGATTLVYSFAGYQTQEVTLGVSNVVDISMSESTLQEVVVTAIGIQREKKAVGYAVSDIGSEQIAQKSEPAHFFLENPKTSI